MARIRSQIQRPADNILGLMNRNRVLEERVTHCKQALQAAMDEAQNMETSLCARIAHLQNEVVRVSNQNKAPETDTESDTESESDPDYDSDSEYEPERPWLQDVYADIEQNGCRAQRFARILRTTVRFPNYDINEVYNEVLNTDVYPTDRPLQKEDIHPNFWTALGRNEEEKTENAKRVMELLYRRPY
jgi:hypothetical protein